MHPEKIRVLVVDDQPQLARIVRLILEETGGYDVLIETRARQVPLTVRAYRPAAILLDVDMPDRNGAEVARDLWRTEDLRDIPILFFTGLVPVSEAGERETAHGTRRFLSKMVQPPQLLAAMDELLGKERLPAMLPQLEAPHRPSSEATGLTVAFA